MGSKEPDRSDISATSPLDCFSCWCDQEWPNLIPYTGAWLKNICGVEKEARLFLRRCQDDVTSHSSASWGKKNLRNRIFFHRWRSSELVVIRVSCDIFFFFSWLSLLVAHTEGSSRVKHSRVVIEEDKRAYSRLIYWSIGRQVNLSDTCWTQWAEHRLGYRVTCISCSGVIIVKVGYLKCSNWVYLQAQAPFSKKYEIPNTFKRCWSGINEVWIEPHVQNETQAEKPNYFFFLSF